MSIFSNFFAETESEVLKLIGAFKTEETVFEQDIEKAFSWVVSQAPMIASNLQSVVGLIETVGMATDPRIAAAIITANEAVAALNAFANAQKSGAGKMQAVVQGYIAVKQANAAVSQASAAAVGSK